MHIRNDRELPGAARDVREELLGQLVVQSIGSHDMSVVQACVVVIALVTMVANLLADLVYCLIDPRIRY